MAKMRRVREMGTNNLYFVHKHEWADAKSLTKLPLYILVWRKGKAYAKYTGTLPRTTLTLSNSETYQYPTLSDFDAAKPVDSPLDSPMVKMDLGPGDPEPAPAPTTVPPLTMENVGEFEAKVIEWAEARNLLAGGNYHVQFIKFIEELGELAMGLAKGKHELVEDAIGDMDVVLTILAKMLGVSRDQARIAAYNEIKDRKGQMRGGAFVKEDDL